MSKKKALKSIVALALMALVFTGAVFAQAGARGRSRTVSYTLTVNSNVRGAQVRIDGEDRGTTPLSVTLSRGQYDLQVSADGYRSYTERVAMNGDTTIDATLEPIEYSLRIDPNVDDARIVVENVGDGRGSANFRVRPGNYTVRITAQGYDDYRTRINVRGNQTIRPRLTPSTVTVRVQIPDEMRTGSPKDDDARAFTVFIDGDEQDGSTFQVRPGRHEFRIVSGGWSANGDFVLNPGRSYVLRPSLTLTMEQ
ncbi:MAG: PEGA domain-containing protein [Spirochaetaceae bacterium]